MNGFYYYDDVYEWNVHHHHYHHPHDQQQHGDNCAVDEDWIIFDDINKWIDTLLTI